MYYCPNCKKRFRQYRRKCPICGGPCRHSDGRAIGMIVGIGVAFVLLIGLVVLLVNSGGEPGTGGASSSPLISTSASSETTTSPSDSTAPSTTVPATTVPATTVPATTVPATTVPATTVPPTTVPPTTSSSSGIGLYTRAQLEALSTEKFGYGPGKTSGGKRAPYAVSDQQKYGQYGANFIGPDARNIYLTFDCGYEYTATDANGNKYRVTEKILDILKEKNVKGVFFITMYYAKSQPDLVERMIAEGHTVGNHSNNHPVMPDISIDEMEEEVMSLHNYVLEHFGYKMTLFRPPTGAFSVQSLAVVQNLGYKNVHWSFAYGDYDTENQPEVSAALQRVTESAHNGAIYLLHAISETNAAILGDAIDYFRDNGYTLTPFQ